jgi:hypothetical protein
MLEVGAVMVQLRRWQLGQQGMASGRPSTQMTGKWRQRRLLQFQLCQQLQQVQQQQPQPQGIMVLHI